MVTQALYNRWRGQTFADILGQEHITTTLRNQIKAGRIGHAYLFTGLRGTGKTSTARIMAKAVNCVGESPEPPCNRCHICRSITEGRSLDLIEIDSASNRGIDEIRDLRDKVNFSPSECRYKVYVIDEVHMLTNEAFNALLKTLEEPPSHVIFILCTTEPHRLPDTVLSRCQRFDFRRAAVGVLKQKLNTICQQEGIAITPEALDFVARRATGSFRDAESLLDQLAAYDAGEITLELVQQVLGTAPSALILRLLASLVAGDVAAGLEAINTAIDEGAEPRQFLGEALDHLRALMLLQVGGEASLLRVSEETLAEMRRLVQERSVPLPSLITAIKLFNDASVGLRFAVRPQLPLELAFVEAVLQWTDDGKRGLPPVAEESKAKPAVGRARPKRMTRESAATPPDVGVAPEPEPPTTEGMEALLAEEQEEEPLPEASDVAEEIMSSPPGEEDVESVDIAPAQPDAGTEARPTRISLEWVQGNWPQVLLRIRPLSPQVQALLNSAEPVEVQGDTVVLGCRFAFHRDKLTEDRNRALVEQVLSQVLGVPCRITCILDTSQQDAGDRPAASPRRAASDLFEAADARDKERRELLNHPVVKELEKRGGRVAKVSLYEEKEQEDSGG